MTSSSSVPRIIHCKASANIVSNHSNAASQGSSNHFQPSIWDDDYIQSLTSNFVEESYLEESNQLKEKVRVMLLRLTDPVEQLELIDDMLRMGVASHFSQEIRNIMEEIYYNDTLKTNKNLYVISLNFRLLRQQGYHDVSSEIFDGFIDYNGNFHSYLSGDIKGMLSLYEASFYSMGCEIELDKARDFSSTHLKEFVNKKSSEDDEISLLVSHALERPLHWRLSRLEARWFIDVYKRRLNMKPSLLELAKLDFNIVQATHQEDMKYASRWWKRTGLGEKLSFARDRMVENLFWTVGLAFEPQLGKFRRMLSKAALITTIDDIYDVYGSLEELELFTKAVNRWDINAVDELPDYMKICFLTLHKFVNEVAFEFLKENGRDITPNLKNVWIDLINSYMVEATWYHKDYKPSFHEYLENAWISIGGPVVLFLAYFLLPNTTNKEDSICLEEYSNVIRCSSTILRLANDLGSAKREKVTGDIAKSVECYMNETGASEAEAEKHINSLIYETWKKLNKEVSNSSSYSKSFIQVAMNLGRISLFTYQHGDGYSIQDDETKNRITSILFEPIP